MFSTKLLTFIFVSISTIGKISSVIFLCYNGTSFLAEALSDNITIEINERSLAKFLLDDYYKFTRPVRNHSNVLNVTVQPQIYNLVEVVGLES